MAWLITLALFLWVGGAFCKLIDASNSHKSKQIMRIQEAQEEFVANLYVLGWNHYQELEGPVLRAAQNAGLEFLNALDMERYSVALNGKSITQMSLERALQDMVDRGAPLFVHDPNGVPMYTMSTGLTRILTPYPASYVKDEASKWSTNIAMCSGPIPNFGKFFDFSLVHAVQRFWIERQIPEYDDVRVYRDALGKERCGTPKNYEETIKERRKFEQACAEAKANRESNDP